MAGTVIPDVVKLMQDKLAAMINVGKTTNFTRINLGSSSLSVLHEALTKSATSFLQRRGVADLQSSVGSDMVYPMRLFAIQGSILGQFGIISQVIQTLRLKQ